jgi:hypothetical protein
MNKDLKRIQDVTGIQDIRTLDADKVQKIIDALNIQKITTADIQKLVEMFPSEFLASLAFTAQGIKASIDQASSAQLENLKGTTVTQMQVINAVADSLRTIEETIRLLATQAQSDSFRSEVTRVVMDLAKYKLEIAKILQGVNEANNQNRLQMQKENNNFWAGVVSGLVTVVGVVVWVGTGGKTPPPRA